MKLVLVGFLVSLALLSGCKSGNPSASRPGASTATVTATVRPGTPTVPSTPVPASALALDGQPVVLTNSYNVQGTSGWSTAVVFSVHNPNTTVAAYGVPYRVSITSEGKEVAASAGTDLVTVGPAQSRMVVYATNDAKGAKPTAATVQFYLAPAMFRSPDALPDSSKWELANTRVTCKGLTVCSVLGDLTWHGDKPQAAAQAMVVVHQGTESSGPIIGAGVLPLRGVVAAGQTFPIEALTIGFEQSTAGGPASAPSGPTKIDAFVTSITTP